jgi:hypothetical protein
MNDRVNSPKHYTSHPSGVECIEITQYYNFCIGNAIKYVWRCGLKDEEGLDPVKKQIEDLKKAVWYINKEISNLEQGVYNGQRKQTKNKDVAQIRPGEESKGLMDESSKIPTPFAGITSYTVGSCTHQIPGYRDNTGDVLSRVYLRSNN